MEETYSDLADVGRTRVRGKNKKNYPNFYSKNGKITFRKSRKNDVKMPQSLEIELIDAIITTIKEELNKEKEKKGQLS